MTAPNAGDGEIRPTNGRPQRTRSRRQFLGSLGAGAAASAGLPGTAGGQATSVVAMGNSYFDPVGLYVEEGTTVRFEIEAGSHSATAYRDRIPSEAPSFDSGTMSEGSFEHTFETTGTYDYYCIPHRSTGMVGRIVVGEPGGPAETTPIPDGDVPDSDLIVEQGTVSTDEFDGAGGDTGRGMMGSGPGTTNGGSPGWMMLVPIGFSTVIFGSVGGAVYWLSRRDKPEPDRDDSSMETLAERYARGDTDEEEFGRRREREKRNE